MVDGTVKGRLSTILRNTWRRILPERVFGSRFTTTARLKFANATDRLAHHRNQFGLQRRFVDVRAVLQQHQTERYLAAFGVLDADHGALRNRRMRRQRPLPSHQSRAGGRRR